MTRNCRFLWILVLLLSLKTGLAYLTQSDGYNVGVTLGSAAAALIFLAILFFILYKCCLQKMLQDYRRDKDSFLDKKTGSAGGPGPGPLFKKRPQKLTGRDPYYVRNGGPEYDVPPRGKLDDPIKHGGYYSNNGAHPEEYRNSGGGGSPVDYDPGYGRVPADRRPGHHHKQPQQPVGHKGDLDSSTESKGSVQIASGPPMDPGLPRGAVTTYGDRPGSGGGRHGYDREPGAGRGAAGYLTTTGRDSSPVVGRGHFDRSPAGGRKRDESGDGSYLVAYPPEDAYGVGPDMEQRHRVAQGATAPYQTTRTHQQRTVQQYVTPSAAYIGSSV